MLVGGVIEHEVHNHAYPPFMCLVEKFSKIFQCPVVWRYGPVICDIVPVITQRGGKEGKQPEAVHAKPFEIVQLADKPAKIPDPIVIAVMKGLDVKLIEDRVLEP